jgi:hypothetical protein
MTEHRDVVIDAAAAIRFRPVDMKVIRAITGRSIMEMIRDDSAEHDEDKFQALAFFALRRADRDTPAAELWELAGEADLEMVAPPPDPTNGSISTGSPLSAATGA